MNIAYEIATFRRPSMMMKESELERAQTATPNSSYLAAATQQSTPTTPMPPEMEIDDEFNLPISLALSILITYILCGAAVYSLWEEWSFFESCYFVFVSMSTIGKYCNAINNKLMNRTDFCFFFFYKRFW